MEITAAVLEEYHQPLRVQSLQIDEPRAGEVLVRTVATGVCHTDAIARDRDLPFPVPGVLGHEGAGIVEAVGEGVTKVAADASIELLGPLACGLSTGAGAVFNALAPPAGSSIAIFGTGAVGLSALLAARERGCTRIVAIDRVASRLSLACEFGATDTIDAGTTDAVDALRELTGGDGVDFTLECTGNVTVLRQAVDALAMPGVCGVIGGAPAGAEFSLDHLTVLWGRTVRGILGGEGQSEQLIPALIDLQRLGRFPFDRLVEYFELEEVNEAMEASARGEVIKPVLRMPA